MKRRVNPTNKTIGNPKAINNSINKEGFTPPILDRMSINNILIFIKAPKQISDAMGYDLETHLKSYARSKN